MPVPPCETRSLLAWARFDLRLDHFVMRSTNSSPA